MIDTHCHLTFPDFRDQIGAVLSRAGAAGVRGAITISTTTHDCLDALRIAEAHENVWCTAGVHPLYAHQGPHLWNNLARVAASPKCVAWGELGLDNHYDQPPASVQHAVLEEQLAILDNWRQGLGVPRAIDLPIVIHCRDAFADLIPILRRTNFNPARFVFHCFTGGQSDMRLLLDFGASVSFTGVLTYRNASEVRAAAALAPADRIMVETDAPYLSPEPFRGKRPCEPAWVVETARVLAACRGMRFEDLCSDLEANVRRFYGIAEPS